MDMNDAPVGKSNKRKIKFEHTVVEDVKETTPSIKVGDLVCLTPDATFSHGASLPSRSNNRVRVRAVLEGGKRYDLDRPINGIVLAKHIKEVD